MISNTPAISAFHLMNVLILPRCKTQFIDEQVKRSEDYIKNDLFFSAYRKHFERGGWTTSIFDSDSYFLPASFAYRSPKIYTFLRKAIRKTGLHRLDRWLLSRSLARYISREKINLLFTEVNFNIDPALIAERCPKVALIQWFGILPDLLSSDDVAIVNSYHLNLCPVDYREWLQSCGVNPETFHYASCGAVDTEVLYPDPSPDYSYDVCFVGGIGSVHQNRLEVLEQVAQRYESFAFYGYGAEHIPEGYSLHKRYKGWIDFDEMRQLFSSCKIAINISSVSYDRIVKGYNIRTLEIPACKGALQICSRHKNLNEFYTEGEEVVTFENAEELIAAIDTYLANESKRKAIVEAAYARVMPHSYTNKTPQLLAKMEETFLSRSAL